jgi:hypothetical protein
VLLAFDAAADGDDALGLRQIHRLLRFAERRFRLLSDRGRIHVRGHLTDGRRRCTFLDAVRANEPIWNVTTCGADLRAPRPR